MTHIDYDHLTVDARPEAVDQVKSISMIIFSLKIVALPLLFCYL